MTLAVLVWLLLWNIGESRLSVGNTVSAVRTEIVAVREERLAQPAVPDGDGEFSNAVMPAVSAAPSGGVGSVPPAKAEPSLDWVAQARRTRLTGTATLGLLFFAVNLRLAGRLCRARTALTGTDSALPVYVSAAVDTHCLFGVLWPEIYLTPDAAEGGDAALCPWP